MTKAVLLEMGRNCNETLLVRGENMGSRKTQDLLVLLAMVVMTVAFMLLSSMLLFDAVWCFCDGVGGDDSGA